MSQLRLRKSICGVEVYQYMTDADEADFRSFLESIKERTYDKILLDTGKFLRKVKKADRKTARNYRCVSIPEPSGSRLLSSGDKELVMSWGTRYRGVLLLVAPKYPLGKHSGKAFAIVKIKTVKRERDGYRWHLLYVDAITPFSADCRAEKGFFKLLVSEGLGEKQGV